VTVHRPSPHGVDHLDRFFHEHLPAFGTDQIALNDGAVSAALRGPLGRKVGSAGGVEAIQVLAYAPCPCQAIKPAWSRLPALQVHPQSVVGDHDVLGRQTRREQVVGLAEMQAQVGHEETAAVLEPLAFHQQLPDQTHERKVHVADQQVGLRLFAKRCFHNGQVETLRAQRRKRADGNTVAGCMAVLVVKNCVW